MKNLITLLIGIVSIQASAQITTTLKTTPLKVDSLRTKDTMAKRVSSNTSLYFGAGRNNSFRKLTTNDEPYGKPLGEREKETAIKIWAYEFGLRQQLSNHIQFDGGLSIERYGEKYSSTPQATTGDSMFSYVNNYTYIALPLQINGTIGTDFKLYGGLGIEPGIVGGHKRETTFTDYHGNDSVTEIHQPEKLAGFILNARFSGGLQWKWSPLFGVYVNYTYQVGLTTTFEKQDAFKHYVRAGSVRFGLYFTIPE